MKKAMVSEVQICEKRENQTPSFSLKISQIYKTEIISLTGLIVSFSNLGYFILELDILKSTIACKLTRLSSLKTWNKFDTTYKTIIFSHRIFLSLILVHLQMVCILFIIKTMPTYKYAFSASIFHEIESI